MNFSEPEARTLLHSRQIVYEGYGRADGLFDIEAKLLDTRTDRLFVFVGPERLAGEPLHYMGVRVTIDAKLIVRQIEPLIETGYVPECANIAAAYKQLEGLKIGQDFANAVRTLFAGSAGCTHMSELILSLVTVAQQTVWARQEIDWRRGGPPPAPHGQPDECPRSLDTCYAFRSDGEIMRVRWPKYWRGR